MAERICSEPDCDRPAKARGLCDRDWQRWRKTVDGPLSRGRHWLSNVDREAKTATCDNCGPVGIKLTAKGQRCRIGAKEANRNRNRRYKHKRGQAPYALDHRDYEKLVMDQEGCCAICRRKPTDVLRVDHCHLTGQIRGLLCQRCNIGLAWFEDDPARLIAAGLYLNDESRPAIRR